MADYTQLDISVEDQVALVRFVNLREGFMNEVTVRELTAFVKLLEADDGLHAAVLTGGKEGVFIRHYDVREICQIGENLKDIDVSQMEPSLFEIDILTLAMEACPKPIAAAINGQCMGGGLETALGCDVRFAQIDEKTRIGFPETSVGILPGGGGTQRLTRLIGPAKAAELILSSNVLDAEGAAAYGIVNQAIVGDVVAHAMTWAKKVASLHPAAVAHSKRLIRMAATDTPLEDGLRAEGTGFLDLVTRPEVRELLAGAVEGIKT